MNVAVSAPILCELPNVVDAFGGAVFPVCSDQPIADIAAATPDGDCDVVIDAQSR